MTAVLVVDNHQNEGKIENHIHPLANAVEDHKMVCFNPNESLDSIDYLTVPTFGIRLIGIALILPLGLYQAFRNDYDVVVAISLIPYGLHSLIIKYLTGTPAHLVIIGGDLDNHADAWYGGFVRSLFRRFDTLSTLGSVHQQQLAEYGIENNRLFILTNSVDVNKFHPGDTQTEYDFIWIGRFSLEKDPLLFVDAIREYDRRTDDEVSAVMVGEGQLRSEVEAVIEEYQLSDTFTLTGWIENPAEYYRRSSVYVMTSRREAMGLTLIEALCTGLPGIVPKRGNIPDVVEHKKNGLMFDSRESKTICNHMLHLRQDEELYERLSTNALGIRKEHSFKSASQDWSRIIEATKSKS